MGVSAERDQRAPSCKNRHRSAMRGFVDIAWRNGVVALLLVGGCATADPYLWPPEPGTPTKTVYVSIDVWHAVIGLRREDLVGEVDRHLSLDVEPFQEQGSWSFEEWGYAERACYIEGRQGIMGVLRSLFWPTEGVVEVTRSKDLWAHRTPQPPAELFTLALSYEGFQRLRRYLLRTKESTVLAHIGSSRFYRATRAYHIFHHCYHYAARALREAGLPISPFWAITRAGLAWQLHRIMDGEFSDQRVGTPMASLRIANTKAFDIVGMI